MQRNLLIIIAGLMTMAPAVVTWAGTMSMPDGWYLEGNIGDSNQSGKSYPGTTSTSGLAGNANLGYKLIPYFGLELGYSQYANTTVKNSVGTKAATDYLYSADLAVKGILPLGNTGFEAFAKLGGAFVSSSVKINNSPAAIGLGIGRSTHRANGVYLGLGGQYYFTPNLAGVLQWQHAQGSSQTGDFDLYTAGLSYIFG